jgi:hypothetical protein
MAKQLNVVLSLAQNPKPLYKKKKFRGRDYLVCPLVMLTEGVFTCNEGAVLYREAELQTFQEAWNNKPIVLEHPTDDNGDFVTATTPAILEKQQIGFLLNSRWDKKLKASAWIDVEHCEELCPEVLKRIKANKPIEVSTGLVVNVEVSSGSYNGRTYEYIATDYRPDHLAVLPTKRGACSLADGAGLMVMQEFEGKPIPEELRENAASILDKMLVNQLTHGRLRELLSEALTAWMKDNGSDSYYWIEDVADSYVIISRSGKYYRIGYKKTGDTIKMDGKDPVEIVRVVQYRLVDGTVIGNNSTKSNAKKEFSVKKTEMIGFLITNAGYDETDKEMLEAMEDAKLAKLVSAVKKAEPKVVANEEDDDPAPKKKAKPVEKEEFDFDKFMAGAPKKFQRMVSRSMQVMNETVEADADEVVKLSDGLYTKEECVEMDPIALSKLKKTLSNAAAVKAKSRKAVDGDDDDGDDDDDDTSYDYSGAGGFFASNRFMSNSSKDDAEDEAPLGLAPSSFVKK